METIVIIVFLLAYFGIILEHKLEINKTAFALFGGALCWTAYILGSEEIHIVEENLFHSVSEIAGIVFFLLGAMTIVELIDAHDGFDLVIERIKTKSKKKLIIIMSLVSFILSAILDNLTTTIVMITLMRKFNFSTIEKFFLCGIIVISANAGGAWSPIGDVTTTMLWIGNQISASSIVIHTIIPSIVCAVVATTLMISKFKGEVGTVQSGPTNDTPESDKKIIFFAGVSSLIFVPIFKSITHLPPYMGMLLSLSLLWFISEMIHKDKDEFMRQELSINAAMKRIDTPSILFFTGILLCISSLQHIGTLTSLANRLSYIIPRMDVLTYCIGLVSAVIDNVPLVAASQGMYSLEVYPRDHEFWLNLAYTAGTGGSCLIIGSAAGVAAMGLEKINFMEYLKKISWIAFLAYTAGALCFKVQALLFY